MAQRRVFGFSAGTVPPKNFSAIIVSYANLGISEELLLLYFRAKLGKIALF